jgi:ABC-2 type transport system ATP-binding protein
MFAVETQRLSRVYKSRNARPEVRALNDITIQIDAGEVRGLLGPNGAGKTTLVKILSTVLLPTSGTASVLGHDVAVETKSVRSLIGIVFGGERGLYLTLTGQQNLEYWAALYHVPPHITRQRVPALLERVGLADRADDLVETYSRGMKQRLHLARGLVNDARVLFFDEPTVGMDPLAARDFRQIVRDLQAEGRTILLTTHDMAEAESVCDRVALIDRGRLLAVETPRTLSQLIARYERVDFECSLPHVAERLRALPGVASVTQLTSVRYRTELVEEPAIHHVLRFLVDAGITNVSTSRPTLEEVYVHLIGERSRQTERL